MAANLIRRRPFNSLGNYSQCASLRIAPMKCRSGPIDDINAVETEVEPPGLAWRPKWKFYDLISASEPRHGYHRCHPRWIRSRATQFARKKRILYHKLNRIISHFMSPSSSSFVVRSERSTRKEASETAITIHCDGKLVVYVILKCDEARDKKFVCLYHCFQKGVCMMCYSIIIYVSPLECQQVIDWQIGGFPIERSFYHYFKRTQSNYDCWTEVCAVCTVRLLIYDARDIENWELICFSSSQEIHLRTGRADAAKKMCHKLVECHVECGRSLFSPLAWSDYLFTHVPRAIFHHRNARRLVDWVSTSRNAENVFDQAWYSQELTGVLSQQWLTLSRLTRITASISWGYFSSFEALRSNFNLHKASIMLCISTFGAVNLFPC